MRQKPLSAKAIIAVAIVAASLISVCGVLTYANNGTITAVKDTIPDTLVYFEYTGDLGTFYLDDDGVGANYKTFTCLLPRQYEITEVLPSGWELFDITIADPDGGSTVNLDKASVFIDLDADETVVVTFTNTKPSSLGTIVVAKDAEPEGPQGFDFVGDLGDFQLVDDGVSDNSRTFTKLLPGTYSVTETVSAGWNLTSAVCSDGSDPSAIDLEAGETVVVTFTNTKQRGHIIVDKVTTPAGDSQLFTFNPSWGSTFQLADATTPYDSSSLDAATYSVTETVSAGWNLTSAVCSDGSDPSAIDLEAGETVTVTFTNAKQQPELGRIIVDKKTIPAGDSQVFTFNPSWGSSFQLADTTTPYDSGWLAAGTYSVSETVPSGWDLTSAVCSDGSDPSNIELRTGETVTVTFTNSKVCDFGDAPYPYPTLLADNGARHEIPLTGRIWLGGQVDGETDGQPVDLDGADEDGVVMLGSGPKHGPFTMPFVPGQYGAVRVTISGGAGYLHGWFDWNGDGDWADPGENVFSSRPLAPQTYEIGFPVPTSAITGTTWARFRLDDQNLNSFVGLAHNGEVEDYVVELGMSPMPPPLPPQPSEPEGTAAPTLTWWGMILLPFLMALALLLSRPSTRGGYRLGNRKMR